MRYWSDARPPAPVVPVPMAVPSSKLTITAWPASDGEPATVTLPVTTVTPCADATAAKSVMASKPAIKTLMNGLGMSAGPCRQPLGKMTAAGVEVVRNAARETHRRNPDILSPINDSYGVNVEDRLADDSIWNGLSY